MTTLERAEWLRCSESALYFIFNYCQIYDATRGEWIPFHLWREQANVLRIILTNLLTIILKARQLGMTWLVLAFALWLALFRPAATILIFSKRDDEAIYLLGLERLRGMYQRLPKFLQARAVVNDNDHEWHLSNGSVVRAFPTTAGDSYTASLVIVDEADLVPDLNRLLKASKPTIDGGGKMILLSRVDKHTPQSEFKNIYRGAKAMTNGWARVFLPWTVRPDRDAAWYDRQTRDIFARTGSLDDLHEQYPATDTEALAPATLDKRIAAVWLEQCYREQAGIETNGAPAIPGLVIYRAPRRGEQFVIGADPAEGNPTSDDSPLTVTERATGEEVGSLNGKFQPSTFGAHIDAVGRYFNGAAVLVERNNHGHAVLLWLKDNSKLPRLMGIDGKEGWLTTSKSKALVYDAGADAFRNGETILHSFATFTQLSLIEGSTLSAPEGEQDDRAMSYVLAVWAAKTDNRKMLRVGANPFAGYRG